MVDLKDFCCICVQKNEGRQNIMEKDSQGIRYLDKLSSFITDQDWSENYSICKFCVEKLNTVFDFIEECRRSETLRQAKLKELKETLTETFECGMCKKTFKLKRFLKLHVTRIHSRLKNDEDLKSGTHLNNSHLDELETKTKELQPSPEIGPCKVYEESLDDKDLSNYSSSNEDDLNMLPQKSKIKKKWRTRKEPLSCEYCGKLFKRKQHWSAHIRANHTFEKPYVCEQCDAAFINSHSLLIHKRKHNNEKPYICSSCGKGFVCSGDLYHHSKIHLNKREYQCNICEKRFNTTSILRTHKIVKHTEPKNWKYVCHICERRFPINSSLSVHMKRHTGVKDVSCHICDKKFFNKSELSKHILTHSNERLHKCKICPDKEYKNREGLRKHLKVAHDIGNWKVVKPVKKFSCHLCPKVFAFNNKLQRHIYTHTGEKPFRCCFCDKQFVDNYYRKVHLKKEHQVDIKSEESF